MFYLIYKITNIINGYVYIGQHTTNKIDDGYMGSGIRLINAYKKHGINSFQKQILHVFYNFEEMDAKEKELVNENFIRRIDTYNIVTGGTGWCSKGTVTVEDLNNPGIFMRIPKEFYDINLHKYITVGTTQVYLKSTGKKMRVSVEEYTKNKHKLASDKKILCYNSDGSIKFEFWGSKIDFLKTYKCPSSVWNAAIKQTVFQSKHKASKEFNGCSFTLIKWKP